MAEADPALAAPPSTREKLNSNVINYLVWRYLQEAGFAMAATWLGKEWHRDPDRVMPFAEDVNQRQLVEMLQDALFLDDVRADGHRARHRYRFGDDLGPDYASPSYDIAGERREDDIPRTRLQETDEEQALNGSLEDSIQRKKRKFLPLNRRINGDMMDIDENGYGPSEQASEMDSPAPAVHDLPPLDTLTIGESRFAATEKPVDLSSSSRILPWPDKCLVNPGAWSPFDSEPLFVGGSNMLRLFIMQDELEQEITTRDIEISKGEFEVGNVCWISPSAAIVSVIDGEDEQPPTSPDGEDNDGGETTGSLVYVPGWASEEPELLGSMSGAIFAMKFRLEAGLLLCLSGGGDSTSLTIFKATGGEIPYRIATHDHRGTALYDAAWISDTRIIACGTNMLQIFEIVFSPTGAATLRVIQMQQMKDSWFQIKYDDVSNAAVFVNEDYKSLRQYDLDTEDTKTKYFPNAPISDFAFQPLPRTAVRDPDAPRLLATSLADGLIEFWDVSNPWRSVYRIVAPEFSQGGLMRIAWSPDGASLAGAGFDTVKIWRTESSGATDSESDIESSDEQPRHAASRNGHSHSHGNGVLATQRRHAATPSAAATLLARNFGAGRAIWSCADETRWRSRPAPGDEGWVHNVQWNSSGTRVAFSLHEQVCVLDVAS